jgi:hypothetical protein
VRNACKHGNFFADEVRMLLRSAVLSRRDRPPLPETDIIRELEIAFDAGLADPALDIFRTERC